MSRRSGIRSRTAGLAVLWALFCLSIVPAARAQTPTAGAPLKLVIAGLVHGHVHSFLHSAVDRDDVRLVGVYDPDPALLAAALAERKLPASVGFTDVDKMLTDTSPEAMAIFSSTADHPALVAAAAKHHVHAMMEKPLAVSVADGESIARSAKSGNIHVIVNYETTWYPSMAEAWRLVKQPGAGHVRKLVAMDGHEGPKEIGVQPEFLAWLTDPVKNGGGALYDFGCYGANLMTWLMDNQRPLTVTAITQRIKPDIYPRVDDEATILVEYPKAQGIIQASWNWPFGRKDLEVYGATGYAIATGGNSLRLRLPKETERAETPEPRTPTERDELAYFTAIVRGTTLPSGLSSLDNNLIVTEILDAARRSAESGRTIRL